MPTLIMIKPSSGDKTASLFSDTDSASPILETANVGTMYKLVDSNGKFYNVEYDSGLPAGAKGGTANTGTIVAYPHTSLYNNVKRETILSKINNGTPVQIIDDSDTNMFHITAFSTDGWLDGFVESRYIYRDNEPEPPMARMMMKAAAPRAAARTGTVKPSNGVKARTGPGSSHQCVGAFNHNATLTIHETQNGWHRVTGTSGWGQLTDVWVSATYIAETGTNTTASVSKTDAVVVNTSKTYSSSSGTSLEDAIANEDWQLYFNSIDSKTLNTMYDDEYYRKLAEKYMFALGMPPKFNMDIDIQHIEDIAGGFGRVISKTILSNPAILSICPGKVVMFPDLMGTKREQMIDTALSIAGGNSSLAGKINADEGGAFSGRMYKFTADTAEYAKYLNALCRATAVMLGIQDRYMPYTSTTLKEFDYQYWSIRKRYSPAAAGATDTDTSIFKTFGSGLVKVATKLMSAAVDDTTYINFFLNGSETSVQERIANDTSNSPLDSVFNTVSDLGAKLNYFTGSGFLNSTESNESVMSEALSDLGEGIGGVLTLGKNFLKGGRLVLPKMVTGASYDRSISCELKFISPYGDPYAVFLNCLVPICHLLAMSLPKQISDNMYTYPFLVRCAQLGQFNVDLGIISGITISRGGSDNTSWTIDTLATEWDVQLEITPLVDELMITSTSHPILFCKNEMLLDYLGNLCGFDLLAYNFATKANLMLTMLAGSGANPFNWPAAMENRISDALYNQFNHLFRL